MLQSDTLYGESIEFVYHFVPNFELEQDGSRSDTCGHLWRKSVLC
jgi:hypothetical protein